MKKLINILVTLVIVISLTSCTSKSSQNSKEKQQLETLEKKEKTSDLRDMRVRRISDNEIIILKNQEAKYYTVGDSLTIESIDSSPWKIDNGSHWKKDHSFISNEYKYLSANGDSVKVYSKLFDFKRVMVEKIFD